MKFGLFATVALAALIGAALPEPAPAADVPSIYDVLAGRDEHSVLFMALTEVKDGLALKTQGPFTLFAPTDDAFKKLDAATIKKIASDKETVQKLVRAHLIDRKLATNELTALDGKESRTLQGGALKVERLKDGFRVGGVKLAPEIQCRNGVIHAIDTVLPMAKE